MQSKPLVAHISVSFSAKRVLNSGGQTLITEYATLWIFTNNHIYDLKSFVSVALFVVGIDLPGPWHLFVYFSTEVQFN